ncbi:hypothetical protein [Streptosporangium vulgare]|uniref:hypothetical protein n=1 Tax=Streptosporangium vulgare TaxID=46190 RepID=UPI003CD0BD80
MPETQSPWARPRRPAHHLGAACRHRPRRRAARRGALWTPRNRACTGWAARRFTQRFHAVASAVEHHLAPMLIGRHPADIKDIFRMLHFSSYWRDGPVGNNAISGVDMALWDIAGRARGHAGVRAARRAGPHGRPGVPARGGRHDPGDPRPGQGHHGDGRHARAAADGAARVRLLRHAPRGRRVPRRAPIPTGGTSSTTCAPRRSCSAGPGRSWARRWSCCTTSTPGSRPSRP